MDPARVRIDRYELLEPIGEGSFGAVYRARHVHTRQVVALKVARGAVDPDAAARILAEGRAAASLRHPNVVGVTDGGMTESGDAFVVMELLTGETVSRRLARGGPLPVAEAVAIAAQVLDGLAAVHATGVIHRDVKPSNIFLSNDRGVETAKVIDFGISKLRAADVTGGSVFTLPGVAMGTPGYMAPEQLGDARSVDARADIYSAGATLFEMLAGRKPLAADSFEAWMRRLTTEAAPPVASVAPQTPASICAVVDRALARDRDARWPSARAMRDALGSAGGVAPTLRDDAARDAASAARSPAPTVDVEPVRFAPAPASPFTAPYAAPPRASASPYAPVPPPVPVPVPVLPPTPSLRSRSRSRARPPPNRLAWAFALAGLVLALLSLVAVGAYIAGRSGAAGSPASAP